jgi:hypothetical protein
MSLQLKKPGTKIRSLMTKRRKKPFDLGNSPTCKTFFNITDIPYVGNDLFSSNSELWNQSGFTNRQKMFIFKFYNNTLGINVRTSHFAADANRLCFFCIKKRLPEQNDETFIHLFFLCPTVQSWHNDFITKCFPEFPVLSPMSLRSLWFLGYCEEINSIFVKFAIIAFQQCIWEAKLKKILPSFHSLYSNFLDGFKLTFKHNSDVRKSSSVINYTLCRTLLGNRQVRRDGDE